MKRIMIVMLAAVLALGVMAAQNSSLAFAAASVRNSGFYDNQLIEYEGTPQITSSPQAAQQLAQGNIVYHVVDAAGNTPAVQCARLLAALPNDATSCNTLNFIPTDIGYAGGAWNLQIFHWNPGIVPYELSSDTDIEAAVSAGKGWLEITPILVRCPVVNFATLR
ncbi:MAG TPA: hypothetical protein VF498_05860 [Anaerolineales bacterium]